MQHIRICIQFLILCILQGFSPIQTSPIIGDHVDSVQTDEYPFVVCLSVYMPGLSLSETIFCSGTLVATYHVLTTEQCLENLDNYQLEIILSNGDLTHGTHVFPLWWISYDLWVAHLNRTSTTIYNDIAMIKIFGVTPTLRMAPISTVSPTRLLEGYRAETFGCTLPHHNVHSQMIQKALVRILKSETCTQIVSELEGVQLTFPDNYICTNANPFVHIESSDRGGPVLFFDSIIAINVGTFPCMEGLHNNNKVNGHISIDPYRIFIYDLLNC